MSTNAHLEKELGKLNPLDESLYKLDEEGFAFMKTQTSIDDEEELKKHILAVQAEAYEVGFDYSPLAGPLTIMYGIVQP